MASLTDIFSHSTPNYFDDEAPANSQNIGERILNRGFDLVDSVIRAKYGIRATIPNQSGSTTQVNTVTPLPRQPTAEGAGAGLAIGLLIVVLLILFLRR